MVESICGACIIYLSLKRVSHLSFLLNNHTADMLCCNITVVSVVSDLLSLQPSKPTGIWYWRPSPRLRTQSPKLQPTPQVRLTRYHGHLSCRHHFLTMTSRSLSLFPPSTAEADCSCGTTHSLGQQWRDDCSHPAGPGAPPQPGPEGSGLHRRRATSFQNTWYVKSIITTAYTVPDAERCFKHPAVQKPESQ